jgi:N-sulfoglucosamine sulfohydrolase
MRYRSTVLTAVLCTAISALHGAPAMPPNILIVLSDDQSVPHLGCYGDPNVFTPNFDRFAAEGVRFSRAYTTAPQCAPSRKSILTGRSPVALQQTLFTLPLQAEAILFPELLKKEKGYFTGLAGRSHHLDGDSFDPVVQEIHRTHDLKTTAGRFDYCKIAVGENGNETGLKALAQYREFLDAVPLGKPFFLQLCFSDPHRDWDDAFHPHRHDPAKLILPAHFPDTPALRKDLAEYYDEVSRLDHHFGLVLEELAKRGLAENTLVLFMGDNGASQLRGKGTLYEYGLNVPLLVRWPGVAKPAVSKALISGEDLAPTMLELTGITTPVNITGRSFLALLTGDSYTPRPYVFGERGPHVGLPTQSAAFDQSRVIIGDRYKLIYNALWQIPYHPVDFGNTPAWQSIAASDMAGTLPETFRRIYLARTRPIFELYDLASDPAELVNLYDSDSHAAIREELRSHLVEWMILERDHLPLPLMPKRAGKPAR